MQSCGSYVALADGTLPEYVISQEDNSPLTLYIDFQQFFFCWISVVLLIKFIHKCMHIHLSSNIPKHKRRGNIHKVKFCKKFVYSSIRQLYCCDITDIRRGPSERATYTKLIKPLKKKKIISLDWIIQICPNFCC